MKFIPYSEWKKINLKPLKKRVAKKFKKKYHYDHPRYMDYCLSIARAQDWKEGRKSGLSMNMINALGHGNYTDVLFKEAINKPNPFLESLDKQPESVMNGAYISVPLRWSNSSETK